MVVEEEIINAMYKTSMGERTLDGLSSWDEEAKRVVVLSNGSDRLSLLLPYVDYFLKSGLIELWLQYG